MRLNADECLARLQEADHGVLATVHPTRGVDAVPVVFALASGPRILVPIDTVKQKTTTRLQRLVNLELDNRCVLLVDEYSRDWSKLWWVRAHATASILDTTLAPLFDRYDAYREPDTITAIIELTPTAVTGWSA